MLAHPAADPFCHVTDRDQRRQWIRGADVVHPLLHAVVQGCGHRHCSHHVVHGGCRMEGEHAPHGMSHEDDRSIGEPSAGERVTHRIDVGRPAVVGGRDGH